MTDGSDKRRRGSVRSQRLGAFDTHNQPDAAGLVKVLGSRRLLSVSGTKYQRAGAIADHQRGRASRAQFLAAGISPWKIHHMLGAGFLIPEHAGVYVVGHRAPVQFGRETSALLACGEGAVLSHRSAAAVWQLHPADPTAPVNVLSTKRKGSRPGITIHHTLHLDAQDIRVRDGLPVTCPARTLIDNAGELTDRELERALDEALIQNILRLNQVAEALERLPARRNASRLRRLIIERRHSTLTRSELEELFLELIRKAGLPMPKVNYRLRGFTVDFYWPEHNVVFELDGYRFHSTRSAFERDHRKDAILKQAGIDTNRLTWRQVTAEPLATVAQVAQRLAAAARHRNAAA
jgi:very-short-patch-repair endonuclease